MTKKYYAVKHGRKPGIYDSYDEALTQTEMFGGTVSKGFDSRKEAEQSSNSNDNEMVYVCMNQIFDQEREAQRFAEPRSPEVVRAFPTMREAEHYLVQNACFPPSFIIRPPPRGLHHRNAEGDIVHEIYTDGACSRNGQEDAAAGYGVYLGENNPDNGAFRLRGSPQTSQRAELAAISDAYFVCANKKDGRLYEIYSDSSYAIDAITKWHVTWEQNGWLNSNGQPVANQDWIKIILDWKTRCPNVIGVKKVQAHGSSEGNRQADRLAREGISAQDHDSLLPVYLGDVHVS